jgi:exonuclease VII small subunit
MYDQQLNVPEVEELHKLTYEELVALLETLTQNMASKDIGIELATQMYEKAKTIHRIASERLDSIKVTLDSLENQNS